MTVKIYLRSLGCPKNSVDSEKTIEALTRGGAKVTADEGDADIVIVNTCGFIDEAKEESVDTILELAELKEVNPAVKLAVMGCLSERYKDDLLTQIPEIDHIYGVDELDKIVTELAGTSPNPPDPDAQHRSLPSSAGWSYLKISEGCSNTCSFCVIPKIRGPYKSREMESVITEAKSLTTLGIKELILVAQDSTLYGADLRIKNGLIKLLAELCGLNDLQWIRVLYMYPALITDDLLDIMTSGGKLLPYFDMPIQHGSNKILQAMGRPERRDDICRLVEKIRSADVDTTIRTSVIVGFPGETDADFKNLIDLIRTAEFDNLGAFEYSPEEDSAAFNLPDRVDGAVVKERWSQVMELQREISTRRLASTVGKTISVIVEGFDDENTLLYGRSWGQAPQIDGVVILDGVDQLPGSIIDVEVTDATEYDLIARPV